MNSAVIYYSRTNNTKFVGEQIGDFLGSKVITLRDKKNRKGAWNWIMAGRDAIMKNKTEIEEVNFQPENYKLIFLGIPNWAGQIPPAMRAFLENNKLAGKKILLFCTQDSSGAEKVFAAMKEILPDSEIIDQKAFNKPLRNQQKVIDEINGWLLKYQQPTTNN